MTIVARVRTWTIVGLAVVGVLVLDRWIWTPDWLVEHQLKRERAIGQPLFNDLFYQRLATDSTGAILSTNRELCFHRHLRSERREDGQRRLRCALDVTAADLHEFVRESAPRYIVLAPQISAEELLARDVGADYRVEFVEQGTTLLIRK